MPPKKKARKAPSTPSGDVPDQPAEEVPEPMELDSGKEDLVLDAWTDEQETSLFKSMIRWKPVGRCFCHPTHGLREMEQAD